MISRRECMLVLFAFVLPSTTQAQEPPVRTIAFEDPEVFCHILHHNKKQRLTALAAVEDLTRDPADTILIIFGNPRHKNVSHALGQVREFQAQGGAVLIATDKPFDHVQTPIRIFGQPVRRSRGFEGDGRCPWLALLSAEDQGNSWDRVHPIFHLVLNGVATNCPSSVRIDDQEAPIGPLLSFPSEPIFAFKGKGQRDHYIVGSARDAPPSGRALYVAGHGIFMNGMLLQSKTDNFAFAVNIVDWLSEAPNGKQRTKALLIVDGTIVPEFDMQLTPPPPPIPMPPRTIINRLLRNLQEERFFHRLFYEHTDLERTTALVLSLAVGGLLIYGAKKILERRQPNDPAAPRMVGTVTPSAPGPNAIHAQQNATLLHANLRREARQLARAWLHQEFGIEPERWNDDLHAHLRVQRSFWTGGVTQAQADLVLRMARVARGAHISYRDLLHLARTLQDLGQALRAGRVTLLIDGKNVRKPA